jgi:hypothetical protein
MANTSPATLSDLQAAIEVMVNNDTDTPTSTDEEYILRLSLINTAIGNWEETDVFWDELYATYTHGSTVAAATYVLTFTDFRFAAGHLQLILNGQTEYVPIISPEEYEGYRGEARVVFLTGNNNAGWTLNLGWTPVAGDGTYGATIKIKYYKYAVKLASAADKPEMSDKNYILYWVTAQKSLLEGQKSKYSVFTAEADRCLEQMKIQNTLSPTNSDDVNLDLDAINHGAIIGD